ncbi:MAG: uracil-DNA glycosylase [Motiliproteus sp.]|jgi:uracil-DNA glycosylase
MNEQQLPPDWQVVLAEQFDCDYMQKLQAFLELQALQHRVYPPPKEVFAALDLCPLDRVKVVILGQDPYHGPGQAHGLSFSVKPGIKIPPSLANIYKELQQDVGCKPVDHGCLDAWARQGVLLLNAVLTVQQASPNSHQGQGWERFTDRIIQLLNDRQEGLVFMLWGAYAQKKGAFIDTGRHCVLSAPHPSPLSAYRGFFGSGHFSKANAYLQARGEAPIDWQLASSPAETAVQPSLF